MWSETTKDGEDERKRPSNDQKKVEKSELFKIIKK